VTVLRINESLTVQLNYALDEIAQMREERAADRELIAKLQAALRAADELVEWHAQGVR
jgi:hypothetical protein